MALLPETGFITSTGRQSLLIRAAPTVHAAAANVTHAIHTPQPQVVLIHLTDWTNVAVAVGTIALAVFTAGLVAGVFVAAKQLSQDRKFNQALQTGDLIQEWGAPSLRSMRRTLDHSENYDDNRSRTTQMYYLLKKSNDQSWYDFLKFIEDTGELAEKTGLYIEKRLVDADMMYQHLGYDILSTYYYLQDALADRTRNEDMLYDGFRDLAIAVQIYAKRYPNRIDIRSTLVNADFPALVYKLDEVAATS